MLNYTYIRTLRLCMNHNFANKIGDYNILQQYNMMPIPVMVLCYMHIYVRTYLLIFQYYFSIVLSSTNILQLLMLFTGTVSSIYEKSVQKVRYIPVLTRLKRSFSFVLFMKNYLYQFVTGIISLICLISFYYRYLRYGTWYSNSNLILP